ncbi:hypothetical protein PR048_026846 [Dryococelus australis]|uniref:Uncharacterized protein n=1 Tax=Dryococelus australis TaxID=614101 RepID=A0ABQ9GMG6_9NEOP|nr:hypothetical protein PR048_026846 [Dryococelus australis]
MEGIEEGRRGGSQVFSEVGEGITTAPRQSEEIKVARDSKQRRKINVERLDPLLTVISGAVALFLLLLLAPWRRFQRGCSDSAVGPFTGLHCREVCGEVHRGTDCVCRPKEMFSMRDEVVEVYRMPHDGNSLFAALAHQQYHDAVGLEEHRRHTAALREMIYHAIWSSTAKNLLESIYLHGARYTHLASDTDQMQHYLEDLARPGFHGGREVIQYIADFAKADIIIFPEGGDKEFVVSAEPGVTNVLGISRRLLLDRWPPDYISTHTAEWSLLCIEERPGADMQLRFLYS